MYTVVSYPKNVKFVALGKIDDHHQKPEWFKARLSWTEIKPIEVVNGEIVRGCLNRKETVITVALDKVNGQVGYFGPLPWDKYSNRVVCYVPA